MTIKFFNPNDPRISHEEKESWFRKTFHIVAIEEMEGSPSAYFIMEVKPNLKQHYRDHTSRFIVKQKNFNKMHFANYDEALAVINKVKDSNYGK